MVNFVELADKPVAPVMAAWKWNTNADLIADLHKLGYIRDTDKVLDPTYGKGGWWTRYSPEYLVHHDLATHGVDFRKMPWHDNHFDVVAFDPPYVATGGRSTTGIPEFYMRYGMIEAPKDPQGVQMLINDGMDECMRVSKGLVLVKCQSYVSSGRIWPGEFLTFNHAMKMGMSLEDHFTMVTSPRPQPSGRRQVHARRNSSTLFVFKKGKQ